MKKSAIFLLVLFISAAAFAFSNIPTSSKIKDFALKDLSGNKVSLDSYNGKVVLLVFFTTWCPSCQDEIPQIEAIYRKYRSKNFEAVGVNLRENRDSVQIFAKENKISFTILLDEKGDVGALYKVKYIPMIFILDRSGQIKYSSLYPPAEDIEREVKKALK
jgi:peroxiredoxin